MWPRVDTGWLFQERTNSAFGHVQAAELPWKEKGGLGFSLPSVRLPDLSGGLDSLAEDFKARRASVYSQQVSSRKAVVRGRPHCTVLGSAICAAIVLEQSHPHKPTILALITEVLLPFPGPSIDTMCQYWQL